MSERSLEAAVLPNGSIQLEWVANGRQIAQESTLLQNEIAELAATDPAGWLFFLGFSKSTIALAPSLHFWRGFSALFLQRLRLSPESEELRGSIALPFTDEDQARLLSSAPPMTGGEYLDGELLVELWTGLHAILAQRLATHAGTVAEFLRRYSPDLHLAGRVYFHLVENKKSELPFAFLATYATRLDAAGQSRHLPLKYALEEYRDRQQELLELLVTVHEAARQSALVAELLDSGDLFHPLSWSAEEAFAFLQEIPIYEQAGILCRIPNWWHGKAAGIRVQLSLGEKPPATVGAEALLDFRPRLMLGDAEISAEEARQLLQQTEGLAFLKNKWVAVDPEKLRQALAAYQQAELLGTEEGISFLDAMRCSLNPQRLLGPKSGSVIEGVSHGEWLRTLFAQLRHPAKTDSVTTSRSFAASLRGYQQEGLQWLHALHRLRLGACLADDMGMGKTVQVLAFLDVLATRQKKSGKTIPSLLVLPASLLANWTSEITTFAPRLRFLVAHPDFHRPGPVPEPDAEQLAGLDLVLTTYTLTQRYAWIQNTSWNYIILDEAQAIKNPGTQQTRAIKKLTAANRIAMTGTPVENRLSDLWSLFDFLNPGLLGTAKEFSALSKGLGKDSQGYARLRQVVSPFILRRLKTDKAIIADLPDKVEMKTWAAMSKKQTVLYSALVEELQQTLIQNDGIRRKGLILSALMKCKQLCNHPSQYLGQELFAEKDSGKFARLREICETIHDKREQVLVFTQFKELTAPLSQFLATIFGRQGLVLHGSIPVGQRKALIKRFQGPEYIPYFVLSLKAGGVGLNLTAANHVIHFDRWWNPAVENQATDRAFRIGQKKNVMVHKFLTQGTVEEKIDQMLTVKAQLAGEIVAASGEQWITEMSNEELLQLFTLHAECP
ncbi:DEAD/DEAH box helicase [Desulfobulbus propionicus]